ncbi:N-ethylammeline chlorohydrolase [candidate division LCP-89 bacterium B3_LCP]|uniref:N-ethylammeline chlorohydrolase n=1 Tax=candidate division LCP-89 bacterium B3_LCP TaxID=2012998 RepID=A0A532UTW1_UNCL8|nr:MAG: N-ethylammeline chlorohydrolase [candidate division LCP-89 bacterium B3_LCP]
MKKKQSYTFKNATVITYDPKNRTFTGDVCIEDGIITAIGADLACKDDLIDANGKLLLPGLIQSHVHLCQTSFRGKADGLGLMPWLESRIWPLEAEHTPESIYQSARLGLEEMILSGVTTVCTMETVHHTGSVFSACEDAGVRAIVGKALMDRGQGVPEKLIQPWDEALSELEELHKEFHDSEDGRLKIAVTPRFVLSCSENLLREAYDFAVKHDLVFHTHASENIKEVESVRSELGCGNIEYLHRLGTLGEKTLLTHVVWPEDGELDLIRQTQTKVAHCPTTNLKLGSGIARVAEMLERGIQVGLGSDGAACNNTLDLWGEMKLAALLASYKSGPGSVDPGKILGLATLGGARAIGWNDEIGSIEVGKRADLIMVNPDGPHWQGGDDWFSKIVYCGKAADVELVMVNGCMLVENGKLI